VMKVKVVNHGCVTDRSGEGTVSFWKLVSKDTPDFDFDVRLSCSEVSGKRDAVVTLHFSGVRICPVARRQDEF